MIEEKTLKTLQFLKVLEMLSEKTVFFENYSLALNIKPETSFKKANELLNMTSLARELVSVYNYPGFINMINCDDIIKRANIGSALTPRNLIDINLILKNMRISYNWAKGIDKKENYKDFLYLFEVVHPNKQIEDRIDFCIESEEKINDHASSDLADIRRKIAVSTSKIRGTLESIIHSNTYSKYLQDSLITLRGDRFVVPVKSEYRNEIKGLVHDTSGSGATLFIEPMQVVELNNEIRILRGKEKEEIEKILLELSALVSTYSEEIRIGYKALLDIDIVFSKVRLAESLNCNKPELISSGFSKLTKARHPLIDKEKVVPININIDKAIDSIIITGPNTGGKTVAIKTLGLLTVMAQSGMYIPADIDSKVHVYENIFTDIGDEQSIEQSLSTFSAHMTNIIAINNKADNNSLILLDELCSGTDPIEGASLAISIIEEFRRKGSNVVATTHYAELKIYAIETSGVENASCEFDLNTLRPTYKLIIGIPGRSNAFEISHRLGLPDSIINVARENISSSSTRFENVIAELEKTRLELENQKEEAYKERATASQMLFEAKTKLDTINKTREKEMDSVKAQARRIIEQTKIKTDSLLDELEDIKKEKNTDEFNKRLSCARSNIRLTLNEAEDIFNPVINNKNTNYVLPRKLQKGDIVFVRTLNKEGIVVDISSGDKVLVQAGLIKTTVPLSDLELGEKKKNFTQKKGKGSIRGVTSNALRQIHTELDLRGMDGQTAIIELKAFIDSAIISNIPSIRIIHGKGTGVLRSEVQKHLKQNKAIKTFRLGIYGEGEDGVTIAELK